MGKKIWLSMNPRNFGSRKITRTYVHPLHVSRGEILHFKYPRVSAVNRIATQTLRDNKRTTKPILSFDLILMSTLTWITEKELELEIRNKGDQFCWKNNVKIL